MSNTHRGAARTARRAPAPPPSTIRSRHPVLVALIPLGLVVAALVTSIAIYASSGPSELASAPNTTGAHGATAPSDTGATALPAGVLGDVTSVSPSTLNAVGAAGLASPAKVSGQPRLLTGTGGKPEILYVGAEYCPYCAAERWGLVEALSQFGTFSGLSATHSSTTDVDPGTRTFSFYGSTYSSPYLSFVPVEEETNQPSGNGYATLQTPTAAQANVLQTLDVSPYTPEPGSIPFISIGGRWLFIGASYNPAILQGLSMEQIAAQLNQPSSPVAQAIDGTANEMTAAICAVTGGQPASVCATPAISALTKAMGA